MEEDCGCGSATENIRDYNTYKSNKYEQDPLVGKKVSLIDGRRGRVDDSIRNSMGEVIGYVIEGERGMYRVFKDKINGTLDEQGEGMASLDGTPGMGDVTPPMPGKDGSGDKFPSLTVGTPAARGNKKKKTTKETPNPISSTLMDFRSFLKNSKKNQ